MVAAKSASLRSAKLTPRWEKASRKAGRWCSSDQMRRARAAPWRVSRATGPR